MPTIELSRGTVSYSVAGPDTSTRPPVVFVHGLLVDGSLWTAPAQRLAAAGVRSYAPDLPLGSHRHALDAAVDLSPRGVAKLIIEFLAALDLDDVTLVGNDTGGGLCQFVLDTDHSRIGRLVLTNCDAFDKFPPAPFGAVVAIARRPGLTALLARGMGSAAMRHSPLAYGGLARDLDARQTARWVEPIRTMPAIRENLARFADGVEPRDLLDVSTRLRDFTKPARIVWGAGDRFFRLSLARRLVEAFPNATLTEVAGCRTFVPIDEPQRLAEEILAFA